MFDTVDSSLIKLEYLKNPSHKMLLRNTRAMGKPLKMSQYEMEYVKGSYLRAPSTESVLANRGLNGTGSLGWLGLDGVWLSKDPLAC